MATMRVDIPRVFGGSMALASAVRRTVIARCESTAIDAVKIHHNDSVMTDEQLAHRLGMVLLDDEATAASGTVTLDVAAPPSDRRTVTTDDLQCQGAKIADDFSVPLVMLGPGQRIGVTATVRRACGNVHSRFCPAAAVGYTPRSDGSVSVVVESTGVRPASRIVHDAVEYLHGATRTMLAEFESLKSVDRASPRGASHRATGAIDSI